MTSWFSQLKACLASVDVTRNGSRSEQLSLSWAPKLPIFRRDDIEVYCHDEIKVHRTLGARGGPRDRCAAGSLINHRSRVCQQIRNLAG
jgi:hypothetical protein